jgi:hypothetical protein
MIITFTGFRDFVHHLAYWKEHNITETGYLSMFRWKAEEHLVNLIFLKNTRQGQTSEYW